MALYVEIQLFLHHVLKMLSYFLMYIFDISKKKQVTVLWTYISDSQFYSFDLCVFAPVPC